MLHFDPAAFRMHTSPLYKIVCGLKETYDVPFCFEHDLGYSRPGCKILGRFDFKPRQILIDRLLPYDSPRFRWTLSHEIGHLVLHRKLNPMLITTVTPQFVDTREQLHFIRTSKRSELEWIEWQANQFASALLLPRPIIHTALVTIQNQLEIRRPGSIYLDDQRHNLRDYVTILRLLAERMNVSRTMLRIRLLNLGILIDARPSRRDHIQDALRALFSEEKISN